LSRGEKKDHALRKRNRRKLLEQGQAIAGIRPSRYGGGGGGEMSGGGVQKKKQGGCGTKNEDPS